MTATITRSPRQQIDQQTRRSEHRKLAGLGNKGLALLGKHLRLASEL